MGSVILQTPFTESNSNKGRKVILKITFGSTELQAEAVDKSTGLSIGTSINFLHTTS